MKNRIKKHIKNLISVLLCFSIICAGFFKTPEAEALAATKTFTLSQAKSLAMAFSDEYSMFKSKRTLKKIAYDDSVKAVNLKVKNKTTFRWSPLLKFHFPESLNFTDQSELSLKPLQKWNEVVKIDHQLADTKFSVYEKVSNEFVTVYTIQEKIDFEREQLSLLETTLDRNEARVATGEGTQTDVDNIKKSIEKLETSLVQNLKKFETEKKKLSDMTHMDVTSGYKFKSPYITSDIPPSALEDITEYTVANDQMLYEKRVDSSLAYTTLQTNLSILRNNYGWKINYIQPYVNTIVNGNKVDSSAFKLAYDQMINVMESPWYGKKRILFFKFPREWLKGDLDGVRYMEDDPYISYTNALEYQDALAEYNSAEKDLRNQVRDSYDAIDSARTTYLNLVKEVDKSKEDIEKLLVMNALGECSFEEYTSAQEDYESLQLDLQSAIELYSTLLYSFDRLTCGAVSIYFKNNGLDMNGAEGGTSYYIEETEGAEGARYNIDLLVDQMVFDLGVYIPEDFEKDITDFELYVNNTKVGEKTEVGKTIRHLGLSFDTIESCYVRLYNQDEIIADCDIDPNTSSGPLELPGEYVVVQNKIDEVVGTYTTSTTDTDLAEISFEFDTAFNISSYSVTDLNGNFIMNNEKKPYKDSFYYLKLLTSEMDKLVLKCYDADDKFLFDAFFNTSRNTIYKKSD